MSDERLLKVVLATCHPSSKGGISTWARLMQRPLADDRRVEAHYIYPAYAGDKEINASQRSLFNRVFGGAMLMERRVREFRGMLRHVKPDVLHLTTSGELALIRDIRFLRMARRRGVATVYHLRFGRVPVCARRNSFEWKILKRALALADCVLAIDHPTERTIRECFPHKSVRYIPNPFNLASLRGIEAGDEKSVVFIGWCVKTKGVEELLKAWAHVSKAYPDYELKMIGPIEETYRETLRQAYAMNRVEMLGERSHEDTMRILAKASVFILPSYTEGFPNVVLEAMALGKPVIATDVGAIPDMLDGCGIVIRSRDSSVVQGALASLLADREQRQRLGAAAKAHLEREYTLDAVFDQYVHAWNQAKKLSGGADDL